MDLNELNTLAAKLPVKKVDLSKTFPDLDGKIYVRVMTGEEKNAYQLTKFKWQTDDDGESHVVPTPENASAQLAVRALCDSNGVRLYQDKDIEQVARWNSLLLDEITASANEINKLDIEQAEKNSKSVQTENS